MNVANSIALVTGANGGLVKYYVEALRSQGATKIYAGASNSKALESLVADHPDIVIPIVLDITDEQSVNQATAQCQDVTLLINNAGVGFNHGVEEVYPGEQAKRIAAQLLGDPKALEKAVATMLPS